MCMIYFVYRLRNELVFELLTLRLFGLGKIFRKILTS